MITQQTKPFWGLFLLCNLVKQELDEEWRKRIHI